MSIMSNLALSVLQSGAKVEFDADLPTPNIYWCSVFTEGRAPLHTYIAADHTGPAVAKLGNWCVEYHGFRPYRSNSKTPVRRLKLGDVIQNPAAYDAALEMARRNCESDIVAALLKLPEWVAAKVGVPMPGPACQTATDALWDSLSAEVSQLGLRYAKTA